MKASQICISCVVVRVVIFGALAVAVLYFKSTAPVGEGHAKEGHHDPLDTAHHGEREAERLEAQRAHTKNVHRWNRRGC